MFYQAEICSKGAKGIGRKNETDQELVLIARVSFITERFVRMVSQKY